MESIGRFKDAQFLHEQVAAARQFVEECEGYAFQEWVDYKVYRFCDDSYFNLNIESPLEAAFWVWWEALIGRSGWVAKHLELKEQREVLAVGELFRLDFSVELTQHFANRITAAGLHWKPLGIELDGHTFHEKTREQVTYRNRRDRLLQQAGWQVFHISFDEMTQHGGNSVGEVTDFARNQFTTLQSAMYRAETKTGMDTVSVQDSRASEASGK